MDRTFLCGVFPRRKSHLYLNLQKIFECLHLQRGVCVHLFFFYSQALIAKKTRRHIGRALLLIVISHLRCSLSPLQGTPESRIVPLEVFVAAP
jgi:hypothetical protein